LAVVAVRHAGLVHYCQSCEQPVLMEPRDGHAVCGRCGWVGDPVARRPLFVVTGASGSGKTAVFARLARRLTGRCVTFDADLLLDAAGALSGSQPVNWPAFRAAWLAAAHAAAQSGLPTVLLGPLIPEHLEPLPARRWIGDVHFVVLDCPDELRRARINARPVWRSHDVEEQVEFGQWLRRNIADRVDTSTGTPDDTAAAIAAWIEAQLGGTAGLPAGHRHRPVTGTGRSPACVPRAG
jgi:predicted ABC-type ATPase